MSTKTTPENGKQVDDKDEKCTVKSYWYPDKDPDLNEVKGGYKIWRHNVVLVPLILIPVFLSFLWMVVTSLNIEFVRLYVAVQQEYQGGTKEFWQSITLVSSAFAAFVAVITVYILRKGRPVYLVDFTTFQPPDEEKVPHDFFMEQTVYSGFFDEESVDFQRKLLYRTGLGNETYFPKGIMSRPIKVDMEAAREEAEEVMSGCIEELFKRTGVKPTDIDIFIVNCSLFNPTPSLTAMIFNKYKMRSDILNYNLSGMGCSAGVISIDLAKDLLQVHKNKLALVISTENITQNWYHGQNKSMLISNTLFRKGAAAILLSNKWKDGFGAKYRLKCTVRTHKGANDIAYNAVFQAEDEKKRKTWCCLVQRINERGGRCPQVKHHHARSISFTMVRTD